MDVTEFIGDRDILCANSNLAITNKGNKWLLDIGREYVGRWLGVEGKAAREKRQSIVFELINQVFDDRGKFLVPKPECDGPQQYRILDYANPNREDEKKIRKKVGDMLRNLSKAKSPPSNSTTTTTTRTGSTSRRERHSDSDDDVIIIDSDDDDDDDDENEEELASTKRRSHRERIMNKLAFGKSPARRFKSKAPSASPSYESRRKRQRTKKTSKSKSKSKSTDRRLASQSSSSGSSSSSSESDSSESMPRKRQRDSEIAPEIAPAASAPAPASDPSRNSPLAPASSQPASTIADAFRHALSMGPWYRKTPIGVVFQSKSYFESDKYKDYYGRHSSKFAVLEWLASLAKQFDYLEFDDECAFTIQNLKAFEKALRRERIPIPTVFSNNSYPNPGASWDRLKYFFEERRGFKVDQVANSVVITYPTIQVLSKLLNGVGLSEWKWCPGYHRRAFEDLYEANVNCPTFHATPCPPWALNMCRMEGKEYLHCIAPAKLAKVSPFPKNRKPPKPPEPPTDDRSWWQGYLFETGMTFFEHNQVVFCPDGHPYDDGTELEAWKAQHSPNSTKKNTWYRTNEFTVYVKLASTFQQNRFFPAKGDNREGGNLFAGTAFFGRSRHPQPFDYAVTFGFDADHNYTATFRGPGYSQICPLQIFKVP